MPPKTFLTPRRRTLSLTLVAAAVAAGCATAPGDGGKSATAAAAAAPAAAPAPAGAPAAAPAPAAAAAPVATPSASPGTVAGAAPGGPPAAPAPRPFDDVVKGATRQDGYVPVWRKDEKVWFELSPELLDKPLLLSVNIAGAVGERGLYGSMMGPSWLASFRRVTPVQVQLVALNTSYMAGNAPMQGTVEQAFSNSLLGSAAVASAPHKESKAILIDASFLLSDIVGYSTALERAYRLPLGLDRANSYFETFRSSDDLTTVKARLHFGTPRLPAPPLVPSPVPMPPPSRVLPDPRSLFVGVVYNFTKPAEAPMAPRRADPRLGHFFDVVTDLSDDLKANPRQHFINRWRLEKKDPQAALSEPKQPIVFWLDRNIPVFYRKSVEAGILEWNKAFEKIGFKDAIQARQQPDDADWDNMDARHASIRWFVGADVGFAIGPNHSDPRTGEIYDADIGMSDVFGRGSRRAYVEEIAGTAGLTAFAARPALPALWHKHGAEHCSYAHEAAAEMDFALELLEARGEIAPDSPEADAFVQAVVKNTIMHEVGHTLGLKHNFKASTVVTREQLRDPAFTAANGISGSVMDYNALNLATQGERKATLNNTTLGPYDYWAIEYAYKPIEPVQEKAELERIASRSTEPLLAYGDDVDAGRGTEGFDPAANIFDLGDDPLDYAKKRLVLTRESWQRAQERKPQPGDDATRQRRVLLSGFRQLASGTELVGKYVGGMNALRDLPGSTGRPAYSPVDPTRQREALQLLAGGLFASDSFSFKPEFLAALSPDYNEWERGGPVSIAGAVLQMQTAAMDRLLSPGVATRLLDLPLYVPEAQRPGLISLPEVYATLQGAVWAELKSGAEIDRLRRNLQREHLKRLQVLLTRPVPMLPPDALSLARVQAVALQKDLQRAAGRAAKLSPEARAHLQDSLAVLNEALRATMTRS